MQKFIVTSSGKFRYGNVYMHKDLLQPDDVCIGGGLYEFNLIENKMLLYGKSYDYGRVKWSYIDTIEIPNSLLGLTLLYETIPLSELVNICYK